MSLYSLESTRVPVELRASSPLVDICVLDANLTRVARDYGALRAELPPGLYQVQYRLGAALEEELISLKPGRAHRGEARVVEFPTAAPIPGSTTDSKYHEATLAAVTTDVTPLAEGEGEIIIFIRELLADRPQAAVDEARPSSAEQLRMLTLHDDANRALPLVDGTTIGPDSAHVVRPTLGHVSPRVGLSCASLHARVVGGGYSLRVQRPTQRKGEPPTDFAQSLWVQPGWRTIVFAPMRRNGPSIECASVHVVRAGVPWSLNEPEHASAALAVESVLEAMRQGRRSVSRAHEQELLDERDVNPMLAIVGAHSLLLSHHVDWPLFENVVGKLGRVMPGHPDVVALLATGAEMQARRAGNVPPSRTSNEMQAPVPLGHITWPPMLLASYRGILRADAMWPSLDLVKDDTMAERAAANQVLTGTWTCWKPEHPPDISVGSVVATCKSVLGNIAGDLTSALAHRAGKSSVLDDWDHYVDRALARDSRTEGLRIYLRERLARSGPEKPTIAEFVRSLEPSEIAQALGLPATTVQRALTMAQTALAGIDVVRVRAQASKQY